MMKRVVIGGVLVLAFIGQASLIYSLGFDRGFELGAVAGLQYATNELRRITGGEQR